MRLFADQEAAVEGVRVCLRMDIKRILLVGPCSFGKTAVSGFIVSEVVERGKRALFICNREELVEQTVATFARFGVKSGVMRGNDPRVDPFALSQVATIQTLARRKVDFSAFDLVIPDEAHLSMSASWQRVLGACTNAVVIGLTATPCRLDGKALGDYWQAMVEGAKYSTLIEQGRISRPTVYSTAEEPNLDDVRTERGDFVVDQLGAVMSQPKILGSVVNEWKKHAQGKKTLLFAVNVAHSKTLVGRFIDSAIPAAHLDGTTPDEERRDIFERLRRGDLLVVSNVEIATTGTDIPEVRCIQLARPTQSLMLYMQMAGRGIRKYGDEPSILLDHGGNVARFGQPFLDREWSLDGTIQKRPSEKNPYRLCKGCYGWVEKNPCELCGFVQPVESREIEEDESVTLTATNGKKLPTASEKAAFLERMIQKTIWMGWKSGAAAAGYRSKFGVWPTWAESQAAKKRIESDPRWHEAKAERAKLPEAWRGEGS